MIADNEPAARIERSGQDLWILYTGGTTGNPKGVMWPHENILMVTKRIFELLALEFPTSLDQTGAAAAAIAELGATPRQLAASPLMHGTAGIGALMYLTCGGAVVTMTSRSLDSDELWRTVQARQCTVASIVGDVFCTPMVDALDAAAEAGSPMT